LKGASSLLKPLRMFAGLVVLFVGVVLALPLVPGPGIPLILVGLLLLSDHFVWAKQALDWAKRLGKQSHGK
jgi:hypothetical protein